MNIWLEWLTFTVNNWKAISSQFGLALDSNHQRAASPTLNIADYYDNWQQTNKRRPKNI